MGMVPAWIFPGQGTLPATRWARTPLADRLAEAALEAGLDFDVLMGASDKGELSRTRVAQPLIFIDCIVKADELRRTGVPCRAVAGHSLGEYAALVVAGVLRPLEALRVVLHRGEVMDGVAGGMMAIVKLDPESVEEMCRRSGGNVVVANRNSPKQTVVSGDFDALTELAEWVQTFGGKAIRLAVSGPFHSPLMREAEDRLRPTIEACRFEDPNVPVVSSVSGEVVCSGARLKELLLSQMTSSVKWTAVLRSLEAEGITHAIEVGPGAVLAGIGKRNSVKLEYLSDEEAKEWANSNTESP